MKAPVLRNRGIFCGIGFLSNFKHLLKIMSNCNIIPLSATQRKFRLIVPNGGEGEGMLWQRKKEQI